MAVAVPDFAGWLGNKLKDLNTDENVFGDYITGILDSDETADEKNEALQDLLGEIVEDQSINDLCKEIMNMYIEFQDKKAHSEAAKNKPVDVDIKLKEHAEQHCLPTKSKQYTEEEKKIREAILAQYSQMSDEEGDEGEPAASSSTLGASMQKNTNAYDVAQAEKEKRENARQESQKKKEKDKEDREKQKQLKEDKKEKRKTQKGERRR